MTQLGTGEAFITALNEKGIPTPLVHTLLVAPASRMDVLEDFELSDSIRSSKLVRKYHEVDDRDSAYEILQEKLAMAAGASEKEIEEKKTKKEEPTTLEKILDNSITRQIGRTAANMITRSLLGAIGLGGRTTTRKKKSTWF